VRDRDREYPTVGVEHHEHRISLVARGVVGREDDVDRPVFLELRRLDDLAIPRDRDGVLRSDRRGEDQVAEGQARECHGGEDGLSAYDTEGEAQRNRYPPLQVEPALDACRVELMLRPLGVRLTLTDHHIVRRWPFHNISTENSRRSLGSMLETIWRVS
jgi:hypothetical protein